MVRITKVYTRVGDGGKTCLVDGSRISKSSRRVTAYGEIDELNSKIAEVIYLPSSKLHSDVADKLSSIQQQLFDVGAELATPPGPDFRALEVTSDIHIQRLGQWIDELNSDLPPLTSFVLPGGNAHNALLHSARTICRRAERAIVALSEESPVRGEVIRFVNRLSDLLFVMARYVISREQGDEVLWKPGSGSGSGA